MAIKLLKIKTMNNSTYGGEQSGSQSLAPKLAKCPKCGGTIFITRTNGKPPVCAKCEAEKVKKYDLAKDHFENWKQWEKDLGVILEEIGVYDKIDFLAGKKIRTFIQKTIQEAREEERRICEVQKEHMNDIGLKALREERKRIIKIGDKMKISKCNCKNPNRECYKEWCGCKTEDYHKAIKEYQEIIKTLIK